MKKTIAALLALVCLFTVTLPSFAAPIPQNNMVAEATDGIAACIGTDTAGAAVVLIENGRGLLAEGFGYADLNGGRLVTPETVFELGELSGLLVALAAYQLADAGRLDLSADVAQYLPEDLIRFSSPVTVKQLLLGSAGLEGRTFDLIFSKDSYRFSSLEKALRAQIPRQIQQGDSFYAYSPFGVALVALAIERVTGMTYEAYVEQQVLLPLQMQDTVLNPTASTPIPDVAVGHIANGSGEFAVADEGGRSYAALYPAGGALSSARDMERLLSFLLNGNEAVMSDAARTDLLQARFQKGVFSLSAPALSVKGGSIGSESTTFYFGSSLWIDLAMGRCALVMTNTADSNLLALPATLCGAVPGASVTAGGTLLDVAELEGYFVPADSESGSFVGRLLRKDRTVETVANDDGTLSFCGRRLVQIAPGVFADADGDQSLAILQLLLDENGDVAQVITAEGQTYLAVGFFEYSPIATVLFWALILIAAFFAVAAVLSLIRYFMTRYSREHRSFVHTLPLLLAGLISLCTFLQMLIGINYGSTAFYTFFEAMSILILLLCIGTVAAFVLAFMAALPRRGMPARTIRYAVLFLAFVLLMRHWGIMVL